MSARLTLTTPIAVPNVRFVDCVDRITDDPDTGELFVTLELRQAGNILVARVQCRITNGQADGIRAKVAPAGPADWAEVFSTSAGVSTAYTTCKAQYQSGGRTGLLTQMQTLGLLPAGVVA